MKKYWTWWFSLSVHVAAVGYILIHMSDHEEVHHHGEHVHIDIESSSFAKETLQPKKAVKRQKIVSTKLGEGDVKSVETTKAQEATMTYASYLRSVLNRKKHYPIKAKRLGDEGTVVVKVELDNFGKLKELFLKQSSKSSTLDKAALSLVKRSAPFKKPPEFLDDLVFDVSLEWHL